MPKRDLVGILQVLLQSRRLRIAGQLPEAAILEQELLCFRAKTPTAGVEDAEAWRERPHDDLVLAVALACWLGDWATPTVTSAGYSHSAGVVNPGGGSRVRIADGDQASFSEEFRMSFGAFSNMNRQPFSPRFQALREWDTAVAVPEEPVTAVEFTIGLDLGKSQDYSALCIVERTAPPEGEATYSVRHLHRWPLGTSYTKVAEDVAEYAYRPGLCYPRIAADATGVGQAVMEMIAEELREKAGAGQQVELCPVVIGGGHAVSRGPDMTYRIAKVQLVSVLRAMFSGRRLRSQPGFRKPGS